MQNGRTLKITVTGGGSLRSSDRREGGGYNYERKKEADMQAAQLVLHNPQKSGLIKL